MSDKTKFFLLCIVGLLVFGGLLWLTVISKP